jgi:uncharacterized protein (DUF2147 family)
MRLICFFLLLVPLVGNGQSIVGRWTTIDDETGKPKSIVEIFENGGKFYGKIVKLINPENGPDPVCDQCPEDDDRYNKKIIGMEIIRNMKKDGDEFGDGTILDPKVGKIYRCRLWLENDVLKVRGYWGPFYRTQTWNRVR